MPHAKAWPLAALVCLVAAGTARADAASAAAAESLFREGRSAARAGDFATACAKFADSQRLDPSAGALLNLGDCSQHLGKWAAAIGYFRSAIAQLDASDDRLARARVQLATLEAQTPRVSISLSPGSPSGTEVTCDGRALGAAEIGPPLLLDPGTHVFVVRLAGRPDTRTSITLAPSAVESLVLAPADAQEERSSASVRGFVTLRVQEDASERGLTLVLDGRTLERPAWSAPVPVEAGRHTLLASAPGRTTFRAEVEIAPGHETQEIDVPLLALAPSQPKADDAGARRTTGYAIGGLGVVVVAVGSVFGVLAIQRNADATARCPGNVCLTDADTAASTRDQSAARTNAVVANVGIVAGVLALAAGAYFVLTSRPSRAAQARGALFGGAF